MRKSLLLIAVLGTFAVPAMAEEMAAAAEPTSPHTFTYNIGLYSQYIFRGLTQTGKEPALQGGVDYSHSSGFYLGTWGSNVSWLADGGYKRDSSLEVDVYGGYKNTIGDTGITYDLGVLQYLYAGSTQGGLKDLGLRDPNTTEVYGALGWKWLTLKNSYVVSKGAFGVDDGRGTNYVELNGLYPIGETGYSILAHVGYQYFDGSPNTPTGKIDNDDVYTYTDYKLGATKSWANGVNVGGYYTATDAEDAGWKNAGTNNRNLGKDAFTFFVQKTF